MSFYKVLIGTATALAVISGATIASAGEDEIKYRKAVMKAVGGHMGAIATILKTNAGDPKDLAAHANAMVSLAKISANAFPENSGPLDGKTEALPAVWDKPDEFKKVTAAFIAEAEKVAAAAKTGDKGAVGAALGGLGKNGCKACHDGFREKK